MSTEGRMRGIARFAVVAAGITLLTACITTDSDTNRIQSQTPSYTLTADELYRDYEANEVAADATYKGRIVVVSGTVQSIGKDIMDTAYVVIGGTGILDGVQCMFTRDEEASVARLSVGQRVSIQGEVSGRVIGNVLIRGSRLR